MNVTKLGRNYSTTTLKILFALSGNECAHPECTNRLIADATEESDHVVIANICHIYAISPDGPRGKPGLAQDELNAPDNLILLCPNHHALVDGQHDTYSAEMLRSWKRSHESKMQKRLSVDGASVPLEVPWYSTPLIDQKIEDEIDVLRKSRFFVEFATARSSLTLGKRIVEGELSGGTDAVKCRGKTYEQIATEDAIPTDRVLCQNSALLKDHGCNLMHRKVLASFYQHLMAEAPMRSV